MFFLLSIFILFTVCSAGLFFYQYTKNCMKIIILLLLQQLVVICTVGSLTAQVHDSSRLLLMMMSPCCIVGYLAGCFFLRKSLIDPHRKCGFRDAPPIAQSSADERNRYKGDLKSFEQVQCGK